MRLRILGGLIAIFIAAGCAFAQGKPAALVTDLKGKADVQAGTAWKPVAIMAAVPASATVRVAAGGQITLTFVKGGVRAQVSGPSSVRVDETGVTLISGDKSAVKSTAPQSRGAIQLAAGVNIQQVGGVRTRAQIREVLITSDQFTIDARPTITWNAAGTFDRFDAGATENAEPFTELLKVSAPGTARSVTLPEGKSLLAGKQYDVYVTGWRGRGRVEHAQILELLDAETAAGIVAARKEAEAQFAASPQDITPLVLLIGVYTDNNLFGPAIEVSKNILAVRGADPSLYLLAARLYELRHDNAAAAEMKKKAEEARPTPP